MPSQGRLFLGVLLLGCLVSMWANAADSPLPSKEIENCVRSFGARGVVKELGTNSKTVLVQHEEVVGYMPAMTMPFKVHGSNDLAGLRAGDRISFRLRVTDTESWIDDITRIGLGLQKRDGDLAAAPFDPNAKAPSPPLEERTGERRPNFSDQLNSTDADHPRAVHPLLAFKFTNELGQAVALRDFRGQALAITFFFTRCPIPDYCPRLSRNFQEAATRLNAVAGGPTNWHFLSVSFDTEFDNPHVLKAYGEQYRYDPTHWSFLTGPAQQISELARLSDVTFERDGASFNHNFRTLIIDTSGHLQTVFPTGGDLAQAIVAEILKACAGADKSISQNEHEEGYAKQ